MHHLPTYPTTKSSRLPRLPKCFPRTGTYPCCKLYYPSWKYKLKQTREFHSQLYPIEGTVMLRPFIFKLIKSSCFICLKVWQNPLSSLLQLQRIKVSCSLGSVLGFSGGLGKALLQPTLTGGCTSPWSKCSTCLVCSESVFLSVLLRHRSDFVCSLI